MKKLLIIESKRKLITNYLKTISNHDFIYEVYDDNKLALKRLFKNSYDLILIDSDIPVVNNIDIGKLLRIATLSGKPIIVLNHLNLINNYMNIIDILFGYFQNNSLNYNIKYLFRYKNLIKYIYKFLQQQPINPNLICRKLLV